jgi:DNA (cytosine-5)-methyltransferase 1
MKKLRVLDLFSGIGGFSLGLERTGGFETVAFCEIEEFPRRVLAKHWPKVPCYHDVRELTADTLARDGIAVDVICGGFPCQDASVANVVGLGTAGKRTGLFSEAVRLARTNNSMLVMENVTGLLSRGFGDVLRELAQSGFDAEWECFRARDMGAGHERERLIIVAYSRRERRKRFKRIIGVLGRAKASLAKHGNQAFGTWRSVVAGEQLLRGSDGLSVGMERRRLHGCGNAVAPPLSELIGNAILQSLRGAA